jgi:phytoene dehydrogenase-like protein
LAAQLEAFGHGEPDVRDPWLLVVASTVVDPDRAPDGQGTLKLLTVAPERRSDGRSWRECGDEHAAALMRLLQDRVGLADSDVLAVVPETPTSLAGRNAHNVGGSCHGGEFVDDLGAVRPGWTSYRSSVDGLYLTGATTHPGGSVSGRPGRNAARIVLADLGIDPATVMAAG